MDIALLEQLLGLPVVGVSARNRQGLDRLKRRVEEVAKSAGACRKPRLPFFFPIPKRWSRRKA